MIIAQNGDDEPLDMGDIVVISGIADPISPKATRPVVVVRKADIALSQGVIGVVEGRYFSKLVSKRKVEVGDDGKDKITEFVVEDARTSQEPAAPGQYLTVIYRGLARVKVDATLGAVKVGDLLTSSSTSGYAVRADLAVRQQGSSAAYVPGTIIGKALEPLQAGKGLIWALIDLQ